VGLGWLWGRGSVWRAQPSLQHHPSAVLPEVRVWGKEANGILTLFCRAYGFYPWPIAISWMKDGMVRDQETHWGGVVPNSDGTYHASAAIDVLPEDGDKYRCHVEHASLPQPGLFLWGEPGSVGRMRLEGWGAAPSFPDMPLSSSATAQPDPRWGRGSRRHCGCHRCGRWIGGVEEQVR